MKKVMTVPSSVLKLLISLLVLVGLAACSSNPNNGDSPLTGLEWRLASVIVNDQRQVLTDDDSELSLTLHSDGRASGQVACNRWTGRHQLTDSEITISSTASTRARCHVSDDAMAALVNQYLSTLNTTSRYQLAGDELVLEVEGNQTWIFQAR